MEDDVVKTESNQLDTYKVDTEVNDIIAQTIEEKDPNKVKDLTNLFNVSINKKNMIRLTKLNDLLDNVVDQALERFETKPDNFSNKELVDYMNAVQKTSDAAMNSLRAMNEAPAIQINQNNINLKVEDKGINDLDAESRARVLKAIDAILDGAKKAEPEIVDVEVKKLDEVKNDE